LQYCLKKDLILSHKISFITFSHQTLDNKYINHFLSYRVWRGIFLKQ
jgi:hypothetical protein